MDRAVPDGEMDLEVSVKDRKRSVNLWGIYFHQAYA